MRGERAVTLEISLFLDLTLVTLEDLYLDLDLGELCETLRDALIVGVLRLLSAAGRRSTSS